MIKRHTGAAVAALTTLCLMAAGCSTKASGSNSSVGGIRVDKGVSKDKITLGVMTDLSGPLAAPAKEVTQGMQLYWAEQNAKAKVCGRFKVDLLIKDHSYKAQNAVSLYPEMRDKVAALQQLLGSAEINALGSQIRQDSMMSIAQTFAPATLHNPNTIEAGAGFDYELINAMDYALEKGLLKNGDSIGHIYFDGDYGQGALQGSSYMAKRHSLRLIQEKVPATATDMTPQVTDLVNKGARAIMLSTTPNQTASAAAVAASLHSNVLLLGNSSTFVPGLLKTSAGPYMLKHFFTVYPVTSFDAPTAAAVRQRYIAKYPGTDPTQQIIEGYAEANVMNQILDRACADKDLTRAGILKVKGGLTSVTVPGLLPPLDFSKGGRSPTRQSYVLKTANVPGGTQLVKGPYAGPDALSYVQP